MYQTFSGTIHYFDDDSLLLSEHVTINDDSTDSEGGDADDEYNDNELPMSARYGVDSRKIRTQKSGHVPHLVSGHVDHVESHPHADDAHQLTVENLPADLLIWKYRLGHLSFKMINTMDTIGLFPKRIATAPIPKCAGYMFSATTKKPWRKKGAAGRHVVRTTKITQQGQCVSVDQLESTQVGFIAQLKGIPTKKRYRYATIFVDH